MTLNFGVITEVGFKVYPLPGLLGGMLIFQFDQAQKIVADLQAILDTENVPTGAFYWVSFF
jgi:hypothetical protein